MYRLKRNEAPMELVILRKAVSKERPRFSGKGHAFTPNVTRKFEQMVREVAQTLNREPYRCPVAVSIHVYDPIPKSYKGIKRIAAVTGMINPPVGDLDNKVKAITDGLNGVAYLDDKQINRHYATRRYGDAYKITVQIERNGLSPWELELFEKHGHDKLNTEGRA